MFGEKLRKLARFFRTVRPIRFSQWRWRIAYALERRRGIASAGLARRAWREVRDPSIAEDYPGELIACERTLVSHDWFTRLEHGELELLNHADALRVESPDWRMGNVKSQRLWTITLHYHEWLYELVRLSVSDRVERHRARELFRRFILDWLEQCALDRPGARDLAWNSYAIAVRIDSWIRILKTTEAFDGSDDPLRSAMLRSLWMQVEYLHDHVEWDLRANHLLRDAVGLARAGRFFAEPRGETWLRTAELIAVDQAQEQVLADGGHFERSLHYHLHALEDFLALKSLLREDNAIAAMHSSCEKMHNFLHWMRHPEGTLPLLNDSTSHYAAEIESILAKSERDHRAIPQGSHWFQETGLVVHHDSAWSLFWDVGPIGPAEQPGHAHADNLSIECSYRGSRLFIDPGTFHYDLGPIREYDRSTAAHNTVCLADSDSSEVWHIFRVGRRAAPSDVDIQINNAGFTGRASHTGYRHLPGAPSHTRFVTVKSSELIVEDRIEGKVATNVSGGFLLAPTWRAEVCTQGWRVIGGELELLIQFESSMEVERSVQKRAHHPDFGQELEVNRLHWNYAGVLPLMVRISIQSEPPLRIES